MLNRLRVLAAASALLASILAFSAVAVPATPAQAGGCGTTVKEQLSGAAYNGVVPEGQAQADESQFLCGGDTIITVQVKNINLPDNTVVNATLDFGPLCNITLSKTEGTCSADVGHFAVSHDNVAVYYAGRQILIGGSFQ